MLAPLLARFSVEALRVPTAELALEVAEDLSVDLVVLDYPIPNMRVDHFVSRVGRSQLGTKGTRVLLLALERDLERLSRYGDPMVSFLAVDRPASEVELDLEGHLRRAPRLPGLNMVRIMAESGGAKTHRYLQTDNVSESGMFVRSREVLERGTRFQFELTLTDTQLPIRGVGEVVRVAGEHESRKGFGARFVRLDVEARQTLRLYVERRVRRES